VSNIDYGGIEHWKKLTRSYFHEASK
ncbi:hypothetical protein Tco_1139438, partial [Tanacetum coccineum]